MVAYFRSFQCSVLGQVVSIVCVMMVCSYIFFEVLDLDGSNFPLRFPVKNTAIVSEVETNVVRPHLFRLANVLPGVSFSLLTKHLDWTHPRLIENPVTSAFHLSQRSGYRIALPRSSIPDPLPFYA